MINQVRKDSLASSLNEAFMESAPQLQVQTTLLMYLHDMNFRIDLMLLLGICSSIVSLAMATKNFFFFQRMGYYSDISPSWKMNFFFLPLVALIVMSIMFLWSMATWYAHLAIVVPIFLCQFTVFLVVFCKKENRKRKPNKKSMLNGIVASILIPFAPSQPEGFPNRWLLKLKILASVALPVIINVVLITYNFLGVGPPILQNVYSWVIGVASLIIIFLSLIVSYMGNYNILYKVSKVLHICCLKPIVHRSLIFDFLKSQQGEKSDSESLLYPDYFNQFLEDAWEINQPELGNNDTVLHCAFKEGKFDALIKMIQKGGNPFIQNKEGKSIESMLESMPEEQVQCQTIITDVRAN
jgi:hypothetical protein